MSIFGECDACGKKRFLTHTWCSGLETYACKECCGVDPREWAEDEDEEMAKEG
jgi:hypothetical protein